MFFSITLWLFFSIQKSQICRDVPALLSSDPLVPLAPSIFKAREGFEDFLFVPLLFQIEIAIISDSVFLICPNIVRQQGQKTFFQVLARDRNQYFRRCEAKKGIKNSKILVKTKISQFVQLKDLKANYRELRDPFESNSYCLTTPKVKENSIGLVGAKTSIFINSSRGISRLEDFTSTDSRAAFSILKDAIRQLGELNTRGFSFDCAFENCLIDSKKERILYLSVWPITEDSPDGRNFFDFFLRTLRFNTEQTYELQKIGREYLIELLSSYRVKDNDKLYTQKNVSQIDSVRVNLLILEAAAIEAGHNLGLARRIVSAIFEGMKEKSSEDQQMISLRKIAKKFGLDIEKIYINSLSAESVVLEEDYPSKDPPIPLHKKILIGGVFILPIFVIFLVYLNHKND